MNRKLALMPCLLVSIPLALAACAPADPVPQPSQARSALPAEVTALHPADGAEVCPRPQIGVDLILTDATRKDGAFDPAAVALTLDGADVTATASIRTDLTAPARRLTLLYTPVTELPLGEHRAALTYATPTGPATVFWRFTVIDTPCGP